VSDPAADLVALVGAGPVGQHGLPGVAARGAHPRLAYDGAFHGVDHPGRDGQYGARKIG
jgi:hypothetical protein